MEKYYPLISSITSKIPQDISQQVAIFSNAGILLPIAVVMAMHHISVSAVSVIIHKSNTHKAVEIDENIKKIGEFIVTATSTIISKEWVAAHIQHHAESDNVWDENSKKLGDPHTPLLFGKNNLMRPVRQFFDPDFTLYDLAIDALREGTILKKTGKKRDTLSSNVKLEGEKPGMLERYAPAVGLVGGYVAMFGIQTGLIMGVGQAGLGKLAITITNGVGHGAEHRSEGKRGDHSINLAGDNSNIGGKTWNMFLAFLTCSEGALHGNHHEKQTSADLTLGDTTHFDLGYSYIKYLEEMGLASKIRTSNKNK